MKIIKNTIFVILSVTLLIFLTFNIFSALDKSFFGYRIFEVSSGSMKPALDVNDLIIIKREKEYEKGDIITYRSENVYITHRIVSVYDETVITKGDANNTEDEPVSKKDIVGKYIYKFRINGFIVYLFSEFKFWILVFLVGIMITVYLPDKYVFKKKKAKE